MASNKKENKTHLTSSVTTPSQESLAKVFACGGILVEEVK